MDDVHDFHVVGLTYKLSPTPSVSYRDPAPIEFETDDARFRLADGKLSCEMKTHVVSASEARALVDPVIKAWEVEADLRQSPGGLRFEFEDAEIIDRAPPGPPGEAHAYLRAAFGILSAVGNVTIHVTRAHYPEPPCYFRLSPDAESLLLRYHAFLEGREPLLSMAYFCLTVLEANANGKRRVAAEMYRIDQSVLRKIGELTSCRGNRAIARKVTAKAPQPLSGDEAAWLEAAVKILILRMGDTRQVSTLPLITMNDLPALK